MADYQRPLAGIAKAMSIVETNYILTLPYDTPCLPGNLVSRLIQALKNNKDADLAVAHDGERLQRVVALIPVSLLSDPMAFLDHGDRKIGLWYNRHKIAAADFSDMPSAFLNLNTAAECTQLLQTGLNRESKAPDSC